MNDAHFHLVVNHLPIIIPVVGFLVMAGGLLTRSAIVQRVAYCIFILGALCTIPAAVSGEGAEEVVEHLNLADHSIIHEHEEAAEVFILFSYALGGLALLGLWANIKRKTFDNTISVLTLVLSLVVIYLGSNAGTTGGEIRHTEIRNDSGGNTNTSQDDDDDD
ncbi:hypothetical protein E0W68_00015 [Flavobacterium salilacus subsp. salilacus]|uniref:hypothetical protein n=1 Tax=Flavobacterium TaxID=237 RepID=UPI001074FEF2|nr:MULTISPECIES: hypothetical protein [Flavobacterium]KAF2519664.1 hypothetical protein E0W68_00015 [Flavobacterium salilacus subsp. salilacus]MBE1614450.1 hypothetical protein [Flavobacterium sp. SaA2.13]